MSPPSTLSVLCQFAVRERSLPTTEKEGDLTLMSGRVRTASTSTWDNQVWEIMERVSRYVGVPPTHFEAMQVLRYRNMQKYDEHMDVGELDSASGKQLAENGGHRVATVLLYLTDVEEGGETTFPDGEWIDGTDVRGQTPSKCASYGPFAKPAVGRGLLFYSLDRFGALDYAASHAGCPVIRGEKWTATLWIHQNEYSGVPGRPSPPPPPPPSACHDSEMQCRSWARHGECEKNPSFMVGRGRENPGACMKSCDKCAPDGSFKDD